jgi:hypothetical protein
MLEILFLVWFVRRLAKIAREKGRGGGWGGLGAAGWFGGEITGFIVGTAADAGAGAYLIALLCAGLGATVAYFIVKSLRPADGMMMDYPMMAPPAGQPFIPQGAPDLNNPYAPPRAR